eukprot:TRINITY_DN1936_c1_g2_i1.p1 TRINITY_DN1936_c1_g2~~TRINITY_DN1936_c1_g2_i1.p1  ORF type:complete len:146 (+),score=24.72 TRINITY_DN1936_c1_g2_i1:42-440(+)
MLFTLAIMTMALGVVKGEGACEARKHEDCCEEAGCVWCHQVRECLKCLGSECRRDEVSGAIVLAEPQQCPVEITDVVLNCRLSASAKLSAEAFLLVFLFLAGILVFGVLASKCCKPRTTAPDKVHLTTVHVT